jgi:hypothetical protein
MYQMHVRVNEFIGAFEVRASISDEDDCGQTVHLVSIPARMFDPVPSEADELTLLFHVLRRWCDLELNYGRVGPGVS